MSNEKGNGNAAAEEDHAASRAAGVWELLKTIIIRKKLPGAGSDGLGKWMGEDEARSPDDLSILSTLDLLCYCTYKFTNKVSYGRIRFFEFSLFPPRFEGGRDVFSETRASSWVWNWKELGYCNWYLGLGTWDRLGT